MTSEEKLKLIKQLVLNISPIDLVDEKIAQGASHALNVAIECIVMFNENREGKDNE